MYAANDTQANTYGTERLSLDLGLRRIFDWNFVIADVPYPIIEANLLWIFGLTVDMRTQQLTDSITGLNVITSAKVVPYLQLSFVHPVCKYAHIIADFPIVVEDEQATSLEDRAVFHHILTTGPPVAQSARRLAPDNLNAAKAKFRRLCEAGICRPSNSPLASPLVLREKKDALWRPSGD